MCIRDRYLATLTGAAQTGWGRGLRAISIALLDDTADAESSYRGERRRVREDRNAVLPCACVPPFGEWLRREGRHQEGRGHLRTAYELLSDIGCNAFAARAAHELGLSGDKTRRRPPSTDDQLTAQELQVAEMAASGLSNRDIAERLYLSHRTVASHLYRVYPKLGITSRNQLHLALHGHATISRSSA